jgi:DEAD/DEAH box helicase domain-containing protein
VLRRLQRVCALYGSRPQFIAASATIANPQQLAERLVERPVAVIDENGAPQGEKHLILYNPPLYDAERGLRRSSVLEAQDLAIRSLLGGLQTIVFARARLTTEVLLTYLRERLQKAECDDSALHTPHSALRGYRGGYLPHERRAIEEGLRSGAVRGVVTTNALELGIDIGQLQAAILCGYPGSIASTWQQMGRAGRTLEAALAILVATGGALDQYVIRHPEFLFERSPEQALINPDNLMILVEHLRCAAFELPFKRGERLGASPFTADVLQLLVEEGAVQQHGEHFHWSGEGYPARRVSLRTTTNDTVAIQVQREEDQGRTATQPQVIGVIDHASAPLLLHEGAVYLHEGQSYRVEQLDLAQNLAHVRPVAVDYYTEAATETQIDILAQHAQRQVGQARVAHGDLQVQSQVIGFRRVKRFTHENLGVQPLDYPPQVTETSGYWLSILPAAQRQLEQAGHWFDSANDYGPNWQEQRNRVRARDGYRCTLCGAPEPPGRQHDVHHQRPFRTFGYAPGLNENYLLANRLENLVLLCRNCHGRMEATVRVRTGLDGVAYALGNLAPLHLMCDAQDIGVSVVRPEGSGKGEASAEIESEHDPLTIARRLPTIFIYERALAGLGFCARLYELHEQLLGAARELILACPCRDGCPACVGPVLEDAAVFLPTKQLATALVDVLGASLPTVQPALDEVDFIGVTLSE